MNLRQAMTALSQVIEELEQHPSTVALAKQLHQSFLKIAESEEYDRTRDLAPNYTYLPTPKDESFGDKAKIDPSWRMDKEPIVTYNIFPHNGIWHVETQSHFDYDLEELKGNNIKSLGVGPDRFSPRFIYAYMQGKNPRAEIHMFESFNDWLQDHMNEVGTLPNIVFPEKPDFI